MKLNTSALLAGCNTAQAEAILHGDGPVLVAACAGSGKCVTGDTLVTTEHGVMRIDAAADANILSVDPRLGLGMREAQWLDMGTAPVIRVKTRLGYSISGTHEHPLMVWRDGHAEWVRLDTMRPGDRLMLVPGHATDVETDPGVSAREAYLFGLLVGDGRKSGRSVEWSRGGTDLPPVCFKIIKEVYGARCTKTYAKPYPSQSVKHVLRDGSLLDRLEEMDICLRSAREKYVPAWLYAAPKEIRRSFLCGHFDTDGSVDSSGVELTSASKALATGVHQILLGLGVPSRISPKKVSGYDHTYWRISITGPALRVFHQEVGFAHETTKQAALCALVEKKSNPNLWVYPGTSGLLRDMLPEWKRQGRWNGRSQQLDGTCVRHFLSGGAHNRAPSRETILRMTQGCDSASAHALRALTNYYLDPVVSLEHLDEERVFDFHVPETHSFIANGIVSHNTRCVVHRIARMITEGICSPDQILAVTFSRKAADEMNERLHALLGDTDARIGTFHSLAYEVLRKERPEYREWTVDDRNRYRYCIKDAVGFRELDWKTADVSLLESFIGLSKNLLVSYRDTEKATEIARRVCRNSRNGQRTDPRMMLAVYERAEELRMERRLLTFDDMLPLVVTMFRSDDAIRARWASRWSYVIQDEAQDQNAGQLAIGEMLAQDHGNYMLVGDSGQAIFGFRGALPEMFLSFAERWSAKVIMMADNYRSGAKIIATANACLDAMAPNTRLDLVMNPRRDVDGTITATMYADLDDEGEAVAESISAAMREENPPRWKDHFVLYRTNAQSRSVEEAMLSHGIPYVILGGANFYERKEVRDLLAYLRLGSGRGDISDVDRCINSPFRFLAKAFKERVQRVAKPAYEAAATTGRPVNWTQVVREAASGAGVQRRQADSAAEWARIVDGIHSVIDAGTVDDASPAAYEAAKPARILDAIVRQTRYTEWLVKDEGEESVENSRVSNVRELIRAAERFQSVNALLDYIDMTIAKSKDEKGNKDDDKVVMMSIHRSKGLEAPIVYLIGANDGILPHGRAEDIEEERRLFYVAVTRARDTLHVSAVHQATVGTRVQHLAPSRFLTEAGVDIGEAPIADALDHQPTVHE